MRDEKTTRGYPLPHIDNPLETDVVRLRSALNAIDGDVSAVETAIENLETLPSGGTAGQVLTKASTEDGDAGWSSLPTPPEVVVNSLGGGETDRAPSVAAAIGALSVSSQWEGIEADE